MASANQNRFRFSAIESQAIVAKSTVQSRQEVRKLTLTLTVHYSAFSASTLLAGGIQPIKTEW